VWASGEAYEPYIGRWSRFVAIEFLDWLAVPSRLQWLDVGCGTGALSATILDRCDPLSVLGIDQSEGYVATARAHVVDPRSRFEVADATDLPRVSVDVVVSGLVLNFLRDPPAAVHGMRRSAPSGLVAAYVWDYAGGMELIRQFWDAAVALDPGAANLDEGVRFPICQPRRLEELWLESGLTDVSSRAIEVPTVFRDFDDYWTPFLGGQGPAPGYALSLDDERRNALRDRIRAGLPVGFDGTISLVARAWAVRGRSR
jgi:SAM-dependent methyltransferase